MIAPPQEMTLCQVSNKTTNRINHNLAKINGTKAGTNISLTHKLGALAQSYLVSCSVQTSYVCANRTKNGINNNKTRINSRTKNWTYNRNYMISW